MARASDDDVICNDEENKREVDRQKAKSITQQGSGNQGPSATPLINQRASRRRSPPGCATDPMSSLRRLRSSDPPTIIQRGRGTQRCPEKSASNQISGRLRSSFRDDPIPVPPRSHLRSADIPTTNQQGSGVQILLATGRSSASLAPRARLTSSDAPTSTTRSRSTQRTPATINQRASRRRSYSRYATSSLVPPYRRSASVSQPYTPEASQKPKKVLRKRPASYKAFGCHRRRRSQYPANRSATNAEATSAVPSGRGRRNSPATMSRIRGSQTTGAPQPKKWRSAT